MTPEATALLAAIAFALFTIYGWLGPHLFNPADRDDRISGGAHDHFGAVVVFWRSSPLRDFGFDGLYRAGPDVERY